MILDTACIYSGVFLKSLKLKFEKLWRDFCCLVLRTCLYDYQIKLDLLLLEINLECFVYQSQLIMVNEDPLKAASLLAACLQLACCMLAACDIFAIRLVYVFLKNSSFSAVGFPSVYFAFSLKSVISSAHQVIL